MALRRRRHRLPWATTPRHIDAVLPEEKFEHESHFQEFFCLDSDRLRGSLGFVFVEAFRR
jgi:hypothetical protein